MLVFVKQYNLGMWFIVHTLCHYCEMVATAAGNKVSKYLEVAWKSCKLRMRVKFNILVQIYSVGFLHLRQLIHILVLSLQVTVYSA